MAVSVEELITEAERFLAENYDMKLGIPIKRNNRLRNTLGWFQHSDRDGALDIEINGKLMDYASRTEVIDVLRHELIHYALYSTGRSYQDGCVEFEDELKKHVVSSTDVSILFGPIVRFKCEKCGKSGYTETISVLKKHERCKTRCCKARLVNVRKDVIYGDKKEAAELCTY
ncbi:SprT-like domain-containing protein [Bacillus pumilus]|uniref:SprT-like domain-containing protein n=1 Tax=Bacillus pumilus TaxID=1408 RepID=UPI00253F744C|nr:SprT-like domain-containing protein [Bacillus pumilus]WIG31200.1 SprT-like domain-containing protein [Bacillus pumilus]